MAHAAEGKRENPFVTGGPTPAFPPFHERWPWIGADLQTLRNRIRHQAPDFSPYRAQRLSFAMADGTQDCLSALLNRPRVDSGKPTILLVHGLTGSEDSRNIQTSAAYHLARGHPVIRLNLRGAGPSRGRCNAHYHAGRSQDLRAALASLPADVAPHGVVLVGVSLGGNVLLKCLGENEGLERVVAAATVCAPIDLATAQRQIGARRNAIYERHLLREMRADALAMAGERRAEMLARLAGVRSVYDFDDRIVAPANGFTGAEDYYRRCSAAQFIDGIRVPTLLIHARNDPWIPAAMYLAREWRHDRPTTLLLAPGGGHVGFHGRGHPVPWHDRCVGLFVDGVLARGKSGQSPGRP